MITRHFCWGQQNNVTFRQFTIGKLGTFDIHQGLKGLMQHLEITILFVPISCYNKNNNSK